MKLIFSLFTFLFFTSSSFADGLSLDPEMEALKLSNMKMPIMYGIGAGGITVGNTFSQSKKLLTPPFRGPFENGMTLYNEQIVVFWGQPDSDSHRFPFMISVLKGYLGDMNAGSLGKINYQTKFLDHKADGEEGAARLTRELYNEFEKIEDPSFNCLEASQCRMIYGDERQANFVIVLPGAVFLIAKEEFQIAEIRIVTK